MLILRYETPIPLYSQGNKDDVIQIGRRIIVPQVRLDIMLQVARTHKMVLETIHKGLIDQRRCLADRMKQRGGTDQAKHEGDKLECGISPALRWIATAAADLASGLEVAAKQSIGDGRKGCEPAGFELFSQHCKA